MSLRNRHSEPESHKLVFTSAPIFFVAKENFYPKGNDESSKIQPCWTAIGPQNQNLGEVRVVFVLSIFVQEQPKTWYPQNILCGPDKVSNKQRVYFFGCCEPYVKIPTIAARTGRCPTRGKLGCSTICAPTISDLLSNRVENTLLLFDEGFLGDSQNCAQKHSAPVPTGHGSSAEGRQK